MKRTNFLKRLLVLILLLHLGMNASRAQFVSSDLDNLSAAIEQSSGTTIEFSLTASHSGKILMETSGELTMKGNMFKLLNDESVVWFDGTTQWTYLVGSDEVNLSTPTSEELLGIHPLSFLALSKQGFVASTGDLHLFKGEQISEVVLTPKPGMKSDILSVTLYISKKTYKPLYLQVNWSDGTENRIFVKQFMTGVALEDESFVFDPRQYPTAEVIDLR